MRKKLSACVIAAGFAMLVSSTVTLAADNWLGTWKLNAAESKFSPGPALKSQTLKFEAMPGGIKLTSNTVEADGKKRQGSYVSSFDGHEVPWKGNADADTSTAKRIDESSYENTWKKGGKVTIIAKVTVSPDGKTLTITQNGTNAKGQAVNNTVVFDKQ